MNFKGAIFDLDGTLVDSLEDLADSMNKVLLDNNLPTHSLTTYKSFIGKGILNLVRVSLPETIQDEKTIMSYYNQMIEVYSDNCTVKTRPYDGIIDLIKELKEREVKLAVFSNKADEFTKKIVQTLMPDYFDMIVGLTIEAHKKPDPTGALKISEYFNIKPENIIYIGDTDVDMQTAQNANMYSVGALWGFRTKEELMDSGAKNVIVHPMDLIKLL